MARTENSTNTSAPPDSDPRPVRRHRLRNAAYAVPVAVLAGAPAAAAAPAPGPSAGAPTPAPTTPPVPNNGASGGALADIVGGITHLATATIVHHPVATLGTAALTGGVLYVRRGRVDLAGYTGDGFATRRQLRRYLSRRAAIRERAVLRPSLAKTPAHQVPTTEVGVPLGQCVTHRMQVVSPIQDSTLTVAPMGAGKTALIANFLLDAPGPVLATSSKYDIVEHTESVRRDRGIIWVFNPQGIAGRAQNVFFDPVIGSSDPVVAMRRALYLLHGADSTKGVENRAFWELQSYRILKSMLWAADMAGLTLLDVASWAKKPFDNGAREVFKQFADKAPDGWADDLAQAQEVKGKATTTENVFTTLAGCFAFLSAPEVAASIRRAHTVGFPFDVERFISSQDTLYLLGRDMSFAGVGPLFTTLTGEIYEAARVRASLTKGGRLDPPLTCVLDEAALICPVPLEQWTADSRGLGIAVHSAVQSVGQMIERWGNHASDTIWDNNTVLILGGLKTIEHLERISRLCGVREYRDTTHQESPNGGGSTRSYTMREKPLLRPDQIKDLPAGHILILRRSIRPIVARYTPVWKRSDVKAAARADRRAERAAAATRADKAVTATAVESETRTWAADPPVPEAVPAPPAPAAYPPPPAMPPLPPMPPVAAPAAAEEAETPQVTADIPAALSGLPVPRWLRAVPAPAAAVDDDPAETEDVAEASPAAPAMPPTAHLEKPVPPPAEAPDDTAARPTLRDLGAF